MYLLVLYPRAYSYLICPRRLASFVARVASRRDASGFCNLRLWYVDF